MSDIRFEGWLHRSGTGGVYQDSAGNVGIASTQPKTRLDIQNGAFQIGPAGICTATTVNTTNLVNATPLSNRNIAINGAMQVTQRSTSATSITSTGYRTADRWGLSVTNAGTWTNTISSDTPDGFASSYKLDCTTADTSLGASDLLILYQPIEGYNVQGFAKGTSSAKEFTASFYIKTNKTGTYVVELYDADNNRQVSQSYTVSDTNWNRYIITFPADTTGAFGNDNGASLYLQWWLASGTTYTSGTLNTSWASTTSANRVSALNVNLADSTSNEWLITGIQLEIGSAATPFEHRTIGDELARCQRYYYTTRGGSVGNPNSDSAGFFGVPLNSSPSAFGIATFPVPMRATPTVVLYDATATSGQFTQNGNNYFAGTAGGVNQNGFNLATRSSGNLSDDANLTVTAGFTAAAEL